MKKVWFTVLAIAATIVLIYVLFMAGYYATSQPRFCGSCHFIEPYVSSWEAAPHNGFNCLHCHEMPGFVGKLESKSRGLNYLYTTITNQYTLPGNAKIFEQNCIGCHLQDYPGYENAPDLYTAKGDHYEFIKEKRSCLECHRNTSHGRNLMLKPDFEKTW